MARISRGSIVTALRRETSSSMPPSRTWLHDQLCPPERTPIVQAFALASWTAATTSFSFAAWTMMSG
jgi:hypothetical protein